MDETQDVDLEEEHDEHEEGGQEAAQQELLEEVAGGSPPKKRAKAMAKTWDQALPELEKDRENLLDQGDVYVFTTSMRWNDGEFAGSVRMEPLHTLPQRVHELAAREYKVTARIKTKDVRGRYRKGGEVKFPLAPRAPSAPLIKGADQALVDRLARLEGAATGGIGVQEMLDLLTTGMKLAQPVPAQPPPKSFGEQLAELKAMNEALGLDKPAEPAAPAKGLMEWLMKALQLEPVQELVGQFAAGIEFKRKLGEHQMQEAQVRLERAQLENVQYATAIAAQQQAAAAEQPGPPAPAPSGISDDELARIQVYHPDQAPADEED